MNTIKIVPGLWFTSEGGGISEIIDYYKNVFSKDFEHGQIIPLGNTPGGHTEICQVTLFGQKFSFMSTALEHHPLNDAVSLILYCADQAEINKYWNYFTKEGKESQCGWCIDKYKLRWQVLPDNLGELMRKPNSSKTLMGQHKIIIEEF